MQEPNKKIQSLYYPNGGVQGKNYTLLDLPFHGKQIEPSVSFSLEL